MVEGCLKKRLLQIGKDRDPGRLKVVGNEGDNSPLTGSLPNSPSMWVGRREVEETDYDDAGQRWAEYIMFLISHKRLKAARFLESVKPSGLIRLPQIAC